MSFIYYGEVVYSSAFRSVALCIDVCPLQGMSLFRGLATCACIMHAFETYSVCIYICFRPHVSWLNSGVGK